jgi:glucose/arabinose dehydrogenase
VVARQNNPDGTPMFASATIGQGQTAPVEGVEELLPGSYPFYCTIHPQMAGTLSVGASAPPPPTVPDGPVVTNVPTPTSITSHAGNLYVASYATGTVYELPLLPGGVPGPASPYITGLSSPLGVVLDEDGTAFVSDSHPATTEGRTTAGRVWAVPPGGGDVAEVGEIVVDELPNGRHNTNGMAIQDGRLYITNGNSTDDGTGNPPETIFTGALVSVKTTARDVVLGTDSQQQLRLEAVGMRNIYDVAFRPGTTEAWVPMNGLDAQDPWGEDLLLMTDVRQPGPDEPPREVDDFGFPGCVYAAGMTPSYRQNSNPAVSDVCDGTQKLPEQLLGLHTSADGLAFGPQDEYWDGDLFVTLFGNFFGDEVVGHRIVRVPIDEAGNASPPEDLIVTPAPLDLTFVGSDMYVADFAAGVLLVKPGLPAPAQE